MKVANSSVRIKNPCWQHWDSMAENAGGKFCSQCSKSVIDFTLVSDTEIIALLGKSSGTVCGRLTNQQLRSLIDVEQKKNVVLVSKLITALFILGSAKNLTAKSSIIFREVLETQHDKNTWNLMCESDPNENKQPTDSLKNTIHRKIIDAKTGETLTGACLLKGSKTLAFADPSGNFSLLLFDGLIADKIVLIPTYIGCESKEVTIDSTVLPLTIDILLTASINTLMGEVEFISDQKKKRWHFWK